MAQQSGFWVEPVEIIQDVSLALLRTLKGDNLVRHGKGLEPGEVRLYRNEARNRWRALMCIRKNRFIVWTPQVDEDGRLEVYFDICEFFAEISPEGVREYCEEDAVDAWKRHERMVRRRAKRR